MKNKQIISRKDSFQIEKAIAFLVENYQKSGQNSKPVILHSLRVGMYLLELGYDADIVIAGILHDLIEDSDVTFEDIKNTFSEKIAKWVKAVSFDPEIKDPVKQYKEMFKRTAAAGRGAIIVKAADLFTNSFYIKLVPELEKQKMLIRKIKYFLTLSQNFSKESVFIKLQKRYQEEENRLSS